MRSTHSLRFWLAAAAVGLSALVQGCNCSNPPVEQVDSCLEDGDCAAGESCSAGECKACPSCGADEVCIGAACLPSACGAATCPIGQGCSAGACVTSKCLGITCGIGESCVAGTCRPTSCSAQACRPGEHCVDERCVSAACVGVTCPAGTVCAGGACAPQSCPGVICASGLACIDGQCQDTRCAGVACPNGTQCVAGLCYPTSCGGAPCPSPQACLQGVCTDPRCVDATCATGSRCVAGQCQACPGGQCCSAAESCGVNGACQRPCTDGALGACQPASGPVDVQTDIAHCGVCGNACPTAVHAATVCANGVCRRQPCEPGFYDLDGPLTFGCEATCDGGACNFPDGGTIVIHSELLPETGVRTQGTANGTGIAGHLQTSPEFTNQSVLGEGIPLPEGGGVLQTNASFRNQGGFTPALGR